MHDIYLNLYICKYTHTYIHEYIPSLLSINIYPIQISLKVISTVWLGVDLQTLAVKRDLVLSKAGIRQEVI
jgi:hypothetical protein